MPSPNAGKSTRSSIATTRLSSCEPHVAAQHNVVRLLFHTENGFDKDDNAWWVHTIGLPLDHSQNVAYSNNTGHRMLVVEPSIALSHPELDVETLREALAQSVSVGATVQAHHMGESPHYDGTAQQREAARADLMTGRERVLRGAALKPTLFLDRDGTINRYIGYLDRPEQIELLPGVGAAIRRLNQAGVLAVVVTNQAVIARGQCSEADLEQIHERLKEELGQHGAHLDAIYHCPHHPERGEPGEVAELKIACRCRCRKPEPGMIEAAMRDLPIDPNKCAVVGDTERDVGLARNCHLPCYWITSQEQPVPTHIIRVEHLPEAIDHWLSAIGQPH